MLEQFDTVGFDVACAKIRTCILRGEPQQAHKVLEEFIGKPNAPVLTHETHVGDLGLSPQVASMLEKAGYINYGALCKATDSDLLAIDYLNIGYVAEIRGVLNSLQPQKFTR